MKIDIMDSNGQHPVGNAPAIMQQVDGVSIFCLPGVPSEMQAIFEKSPNA